MRLTERQKYEILSMTDQEVGVLFKKYLKAKKGEQVQLNTILEKSLIKVREEKKVEQYHQDAYFVYNACLNYFDEHLHPKDKKTQKNWLQTIDGLLRIDKIPAKTLVGIVKKVRENEFWSKNFLSITKLRKNNRDGVKYIQVFYEQFREKQQVSDNYKADLFRRLQA